MLKDNSGFSMIELLATVIILGIMLSIAVPATFSIMNNRRNNSFVEAGIRLASTMDYKMRSDNMIAVPAVGSCIAINLTYLDNNTFEEAPYGGEYDNLRSYVVAKRNNPDTTDDDYTYYVMLVEKMKSNGYRGIELEKLSNLYKDDAGTDYVSDIDSSGAVSLTDYLGNESTFKSFLKNDHGIRCNSVIIYAPDATS